MSEHDHDQMPMQLNAKVYLSKKEGPALAIASVNLNGCFAVRGIQIREGKNGPFVSMPCRKVNGEYMDLCFPCTAEFKKALTKPFWTPITWSCARRNKKRDPAQDGRNG